MCVCIHIYIYIYTYMYIGEGRCLAPRDRGREHGERERLPGGLAREPDEAAARLLRPLRRAERAAAGPREV